MSLRSFFNWLVGLLGGGSQKADSVPSTTHREDNSGTVVSNNDIDTVVDDSGLTTPPIPDEPIEPRLVAFTTDSDRLVLYEPTEFKVETEPRGQYDNISITLDGSNIRVIEPFDKTTGVIILQFNRRSRDATESHTISATDGDVTLEKTVTVSLLKLLWKHHAGRKNICDHNRFRNQCAIRMGAALELSSIKLPTDRRILRRCSSEFRGYDDHKQGVVQGHVLAAQELANWIHGSTHIFGSRTLYYSKSDIIGKTGVIFFRDGWDTTDHIDVWDGERLVGGFDSYFESDFKDLWFWELY